MSLTVRNVTSVRWGIADFQNQYSEAYSKNKNLASNDFTLVTCPSIQFTLFYSPTDSWSKDTYGVILKKCDSDQLLNFDLKIWMENEDGQKFGEYSAQNYAFKTIGEQCEFNLKNPDNSLTLFFGVYGCANKSLFICCEILDLNLDVASITLNPKSATFENCVDEFHQNQWKLFEEEYHDAVIKVGGTEFKVMKGFFMAQSDVFKQMFASNFKEGITGEVEIKDVDENTMKHLIKWLYTGQLEKDSPIEKLFSASDKYDIKVLKNTCIQRMTSTFTSSNAFTRLVISVMHNNEILKNASLDYMDKLPYVDFMNFFISPEWKEFENKNVKVAQEVTNLIREKAKK